MSGPDLRECWYYMSSFISTRSRRWIEISVLLGIVELTYFVKFGCDQDVNVIFMTRNNGTVRR